MKISEFIDHHYRHFNAATTKDAAQAYKDHLARGGKMFVTLGGAMSTAELGLSLAEMIRRDKVHAVCCTGANLEEDLYNLVAHDHYVRLPNYRELTPEQEMELYDRGLARVTDTCIPEEEAMLRIKHVLLERWQAAAKSETRTFPHEFMYQAIRDGVYKKHYQIDPKDSWLVAAAERDLPLFVPGWEDSTLGNGFAAYLIQGTLPHGRFLKYGVDYMVELARWYKEASASASIGFFQIGGGIAGDFPICVVPLVNIDLEEQVPFWGYFCQISDSTTSYGSYSGAYPTEKITWGKLAADTPRFVVESDATIVAPLIFAYVLDW
ncbi:MAG: deoxyhypusine synthase family protein [Phycisphaerae bacterium]|nr:deoxyhypusine synthase family protein [Phycisphaerae bacterium]